MVETSALANSLDFYHKVFRVPLAEWRRYRFY